VAIRRLQPAQAAAIDAGEVRLGHISGVFGRKGEVRLFLYNPDSDLFGDDGAEVTLVTAAGDRSTVVLRSRPGAGKRILGLIPGVTGADAARGLMGCEIVMQEACLPQTELDEYYHHQLIGLPVRGESGVEMGRLTSIQEGPDVDIWIVSGPEGQAMIPAVRDVVLAVDLKEGITVVDGAGQVV